MCGGLKEQLWSIRLLWGDHGEPGVVADGHVVMFLESEDLGVEREGFCLVVDDDVGQRDPHVGPAVAGSSVVRYLTPISEIPQS